MDKNAIKKYAVWARNELIERVSQKADQFEISTKADPFADSAHGVILTKEEKDQRSALITKVNADGFEHAMEEVAYTWFNRFAALRFMEINNYLPSRVRVFTDADGNFKPQILTEAIHLELDGLDIEKVYALKDANDNESLFKYLIISQCNSLSKVLPGMFQKISDYTELLFPDNLLRKGSVVEQMVTSIPEKDWNVSKGGQVEILGWLYQYYISEKHEKVVDPLHGKIVSKDEVPAATQLFTTDWVVRYIIDNSVGRYWIERNPDSNLKNELEYFVMPKDGNVPTVDEKITPEQLTVFDPCMGSAHFGVYAFDVLEKIYTEYGYTEREAASSIVSNNLFGLDIDERAAQLAYFAIMMKAMQYDKRFLTRNIQPHFYEIKESNHIDHNTVDYFANERADLKRDIESIIKDTIDAKEYGSIIQITPVNFEALFSRFDEIEGDISFQKKATMESLLPLVREAKILSGTYAVTATNPPYLNKFDVKLKEYISNNYANYKGDLFSVFIYRNFGFCKKGGYSGFMTPNTWLAAKLYERLRFFIFGSKNITSLIQMAKGAFFKEATVDICAFVLSNKKSGKSGTYIRLADFPGDMNLQREKALEAIKEYDTCPYIYEADTKDFINISGAPIAFWISKKGLEAFSVRTISNVAETKQGFKTGNNDRFLRYWFEICIDKLFLGNNQKNKKWFPCNKGGDFRKWYGNKDYVVDWENNGYEIQNYKDSNGKLLSRPQNLKYNFKTALTWSTLSSGPISFRYSDKNMMFESKGSGCFPLRNEVDIYNLQGFLNSKVAMYYLNALAPTVDYSEGSILKLPYVETDNARAEKLVKDCINNSMIDWNSFETSWDFKHHPLIPRLKARSETVFIGKGKDIGSITHTNGTIRDEYESWAQECEDRFTKLKANEEELNRIFIDIYGLQNELNAEEDDKYITVRKANLSRDIRSFISYAVGCMMGRYSLDIDGLAYAGGKWDNSKYKSFTPDADAILPVSDDEYFTDDIVGRFVEFVSVVYGKGTLEENLKYIADALGSKGTTSREVIRNYFLNDFYADHLKIYQKRPIYWLFDSGKKNGFKCLVYMHRYKPDTIARIRTDYVHEQQARYRTAISGLERQINGANTSERIHLGKQLTKLKGQAEETRIYEEKIHHLADQMISIDLDDGVKHNYAIFKDVLARIK